MLCRCVFPKSSQRTLDTWNARHLRCQKNSQRAAISSSSVNMLMESPPKYRVLWRRAFPLFLLYLVFFIFICSPFDHLSQFFPAEKAEIDQFKAVVDGRRSAHYFPSFKVADMLGISGRALSKITSSFMVINSDNQKINLGLGLKFEAKALKVVDFTRKDGRHWEYSENAVELIRDYKAGYLVRWS